MATQPTRSLRNSSDRMCRFRPIQGGGFRAAVEVTRRCNLACPYCFVPRDADQPSLKTLQKVVRKLATAGCRKIILTGGEPLVRRDLERVVEAATSARIGVDLNSTLVDLDEPRADALAQTGLTEASVSFYGDAEIHDWFVGRPGSWAKTVRSCALLREREVEIDVHCAVWADNLRFVPFLHDLALQVGSGSLTLFNVIEPRVSPAKDPAAARRLPGRSPRLPPPSLVELAHIVAALRDMNRIPLRTVGFWGDCQRECEQGRSIVGVTSAGTWLPCLLSRRTPRAPRESAVAAPADILDALRLEVGMSYWEPNCAIAGQVNR